MNIDKAIELLNSIVKVNKHLLQGIEDQTINQNEIQAIETLINEYNNLKQIEEAHRIENGELRRQIKIKDEYLDLIQMMAVDYDGERETKGLMELVDQLADYAVKGINCDTKSEIYWGKNILREDIDSHIPHID